MHVQSCAMLCICVVQTMSAQKVHKTCELTIFCFDDLKMLFRKRVPASATLRRMFSSVLWHHTSRSSSRLQPAQSPHQDTVWQYLLKEDLPEGVDILD